MLIIPLDQDLTPNPYGQFTIHQVAELAARRGLLTYSINPLVCDVRKGVDGEPADILAQDDDLWEPVSILRACSDALGEKWYHVLDADLVTNPIWNGRKLYELLIADVICAVGVNAYLTKETAQPVCHLEDVERFWNGPVEDTFQEHIRAKYPDFHGQCMVKASRGDWTLPMLFLMCQPKNAGRNAKYRRALYALSDAGLIHLKMGDRGGIGTATFEWNERATFEHSQMTLCKEDAEALAAIAA